MSCGFIPDLVYIYKCVEQGVFFIKSRVQCFHWRFNLTYKVIELLDSVSLFGHLMKS